MSKITANDLITRFDQSNPEIVSPEEAQSNLNFALRDVLNYLMPYYQERENDGLSFAARILALQIHKIESCGFDEWKY